MNLSQKNTLRNLFRTICTLAAILLIAYCIREYALDQDVTHIEYKKFHEDSEQIYPSITICFYEPFIPHKLIQIDSNITVSSYQNFLSGYEDTNSDSLLGNIDYDNVSINLMDHLYSLKLNLLNNDNLKWYVENNTYLSKSHDSADYDSVEQPNIYVSSRRANSKCFTVDIPYIPKRRIYYMKMSIDDYIFPYGIRPSRKEFFITMHYPFQLMRSYLLSRINWEPYIRQTNCYELTVRVGSMEVLKRRNKYRDPCNEDITDQDKLALKKIVEAVGCQPKHWKIGSELTYCTVQSQYKELEKKLDDVEENLPPCKSIEKLITSGNGKECRQSDRSLYLKFYFQEPLYKEINVLRAYGFQSLVGNAGRLLLPVEICFLIIILIMCT